MNSSLPWCLCGRHKATAGTSVWMLGGIRADRAKRCLCPTADGCGITKSTLSNLRGHGGDSSVLKILSRRNKPRRLASARITQGWLRRRYADISMTRESIRTRRPGCARTRRRTAFRVATRLSCACLGVAHVKLCTTRRRGQPSHQDRAVALEHHQCSFFCACRVEVNTPSMACTGGRASESQPQDSA